MHYSDEQLRQLLDDGSTDPPDDDLRHLEDCHDCRERLSKLSGEGDWLRDWMDSVGQATSDQPAILNSSSSVLIKVGASDGLQSEIECDAVRLDFLATPRHPELLGRLGRYDIERLIGNGGFGVVLKARDSELNRVVAIKVLSPHLQNSGPARKRFAREAQASAAVVHDHVVPIYDVVVESDTCYFVMQYISGPSLQERVDRQGPLAVEDVLRIASQTAAGLQAAHEQGLIHRDVKPGNVLLEDSVDRVLISDFGLARASDDARPDQNRHDYGYATLHVPGTGARPNGRRTVGPIQPGERDLFHVHGAIAVSRTTNDGGAQPNLPRIASTARGGECGGAVRTIRYRRPAAGEKTR